MPSYSVSGNASDRERDSRGPAHDALVGRPVGPLAREVLRFLNVAALVACVLGILVLFMGAAMVTGNTTPAMDLWINRTVFALLLGAVAFGRTAWQLARRSRWPWGLQLVGIVAIEAVALLYVTAPPGI